MARFAELGLECEVIGDRIDAKVIGPPAALFKDQVSRVFDAVNKLKVIARRNGALVYNLYNPPQPTNAGLHAVARNIRAKVSGHPWPATANLAISMACQCNCIHCSAARFADSGRCELSTEEVKSVVTQVVDMGATLVIFVGGEPLLHRDIFDLIAHVDRDRAVPMIFTNGALLTEDNARRLAAAGLYSVYVSIDAPDAEEHDRLRGLPGAFAGALAGAKRALEAGILVGLSTYATAERLAQGKVERLLQLAQETGFNEVTIFDCIPAGRFLKDSGVILSARERQQVIELAMGYHRMNGPMGVVAQSIVNSPQGVGCFGAHSELYMTPYGDIAPCDFNPVTFGNVRETPLKDIWTKMVTHPDFCYNHPTCRMQTSEYRARYIDILPDDIRLPVSIEAVEALREGGREPACRVGGGCLPRT